MSYFIDPFGCVKNQVDAETMMQCLNGAGWSAAPDAAEADIIIVNSCGFIESAKRESINAVLGWRKLYPGKKILLSGCLAQRYAKELAESLPEADGFFGVDNIGGIAGAVYSLTGRGNSGPSSTEDSSSPEASSSTEAVSPGARPLLSWPGSAYVKISEGCDNRCAFCAIPLIRGPLRCRAVPDILAECRSLLARGVKELCIIGQDIGSYRSGEQGLPELLAAIAGIPGQFWVRLLYMHPDRFPLGVLGVMEKDSRFLPYFDIPFQHAAPGILAAMNRKGTAESYLALAETIRGRLPDAVIRTTFLTGFPGETEADFGRLLDFQEKLKPDWLGCFAFSREDGTPAFSMKGQVPGKTAERRRREIEERQIPVTGKNLERFAGRQLDVLLEEQFNDIDGGGQGEKLWLGRLYCHAPEVDGLAVITGGAERGELKAGDFASCRVIARRGFDLEVRLTGLN